MEEALAEACLSAQENNVPVGAVVVCKGQIIGRGCNRKSIDPTEHAEILAIRDACGKRGHWGLQGCTLYVTLEPCPMCAGAIIQSRLRQIIFGAADLKGGAAGSVMNVFQQNFWNHAVEVTAGILEDECSQLLKDYFRNKR